ncbi:MAG: ATP-binding protein [Muribaculaceae bacterium]|nr:ATP-binding protein [Muribaculaceae bacterium]
MTKIGFKNFRKFEEFPTIELGGCTFLVGPNNSGKSSFLKAFMLLMSNLKRLQPSGVSTPFLKDFSFDVNGHSEHFYLGDFFSNLNDKSGDNTITFIFEKDGIEYSITLDGSHLSADSGQIAPLRRTYLNFSKLSIRLEWSFSSPFDGTLKYCYDPEILINQLNLLSNGESHDLANDFLMRALWVTAQGIPDFFGKIFHNIKTQKFSVSGDMIKKNSFVAKLSQKKGPQSFTEHFYTNDANVSLNKASKRDSAITDILKNILIIAQKRLRENTEFMYIEAHNASHKNLLNPEDKNDYLAQSVNKYQNASVDKAKSKQFIEHWMQEFCIGDSFEIKSIYNEAYAVNIISNNGQIKPIGVLGTGSIQLFILLLNIATIIAKDENKTICVEEPEQNLHPELQSKLANLFYQVWNETRGKVNFIVETHSEYLIRQTQIIVASGIDTGGHTTDEMNEIMKVYYFPKENLPYSMDYSSTGYFERQFGPEFYGQTVSLMRELFKIERGLK